MTSRPPSAADPPVPVRPDAGPPLPRDLLRQVGDGIAVAIFAADDFTGWTGGMDLVWVGPGAEVAAALREVATAVGTAGRELGVPPEHVLLAIKREAVRVGLRPTSHETWWRIMTPTVRWMLEGYFAPSRSSG